jgi:hypothetical protein
MAIDGFDDERDVPNTLFPHTVETVRCIELVEVSAKIIHDVHYESPGGREKRCGRLFSFPCSGCPKTLVVQPVSLFTLHSRESEQVRAGSGRLCVPDDLHSFH